ncbi:hypothetical protein BP5796_12747 [Coleophoma crateriformis]|uniref:Uncharacterized protein n=1 Tax=Coleophoma crateriformis TaxID=565419 RepID=A0A3D8Q6J0_9HELO|nr:hypothetical protein BP5796_12747 [Coleophoma crateriformis]
MAQMRKVSYVHTLSYTVDAAEELAHLLLHNPSTTTPHDFEKVYFVSSGSEANDAAMKLSRQFFFEQGQTQRKYFVARRQAYHGNTIGSMSVSSFVARKIPYEDILLPHVSFVAPAYTYQYAQASESEVQYCTRLIAKLEAEFQRLGPENVISFIAEPVVGATSGCVTSPRGYFPAEVVPDAVVVGKGLGGGYAQIAAVVISRKIVDGLRRGSSASNHGPTYQAHAVACATALAVQRMVSREGLVQRCAEMGRLLEKLLRETFEESKYVGDIRGRGLFWALEFVKDKATKSPLPKVVGFGLGVQQVAFDLGVALYPGGATVDGVNGDHVLIAPPYTVSEADLTTIVRVLKEAYDLKAKSLENLNL